MGISDLKLKMLPISIMMGEIYFVGYNNRVVMPVPRFPWRPLILALIVALIARLILLASGAVSFHADEAIVGLMARHILQGERPTFFYGQAYMGSLDAWLVALGFRLLGDSVSTIRVVQSVLYLLVVAAGYLLAWRLSERTAVAVVAGFVLAIPPVNTALYTTATLGGYNETLLFGTLILLLAYEVTHDHTRSYWRWALLGLCAGLGWWTNGLIVVFALPATLLILYTLLKSHLSRPDKSNSSSSSLITHHSSLSSKSSVLSPQSFLVGIILAFAAFALGSTPWWVFDITHNGAAMATFLSARQTGEFAGIGLPDVPPLQRAIGLLFIGLPALIGLRFPWSSDYFLLPLGIPVVLVYGIALVRLLRGHNPLKPEARGLVMGMLGLFGIIFVASSFGADPTGRYLLPLLLPLGIVLGAFVISFQLPVNSEQNPMEVGTRYISSLRRYILFAVVVLVLAYHAAGQIAAMTRPPGFTTQFDLVSHIPNDQDTNLIAFLDERRLYNGYTNYWVAFRLAFLTGERMQYSAALPYKTSLDYNPADNRYPPYAEATANAERIAIITTNLPELDARLMARFEAEGLTYREQIIGVFHVYYDFAPPSPRPPFLEQKNVNFRAGLIG